ncbi:hypothetical protein M758_12G029300 [Ceratodon purpureus]|nr:hypothetical protein M758_12G029300 [Ceratodon purpureus]
MACLPAPLPHSPRAYSRSHSHSHPQPPIPMHANPIAIPIQDPSHGQAHTHGMAIGKPMMAKPSPGQARPGEARRCVWRCCWEASLFVVFAQPRRRPQSSRVKLRDGPLRRAGLWVPLQQRGGGRQTLGERGLRAWRRTGCCGLETAGVLGLGGMGC